LSELPLIEILGSFITVLLTITVVLIKTAINRYVSEHEKMINKIDELKTEIHELITKNNLLESNMASSLDHIARINEKVTKNTERLIVVEQLSGIWRK